MAKTIILADTLDPVQLQSLAADSDRCEIDPRKLLYLATIIEHGSLKKAAKHLLISQPALSTSMDRLEKSVGSKLLERGRNGIAPTALGERLYSHARLIRDEIALAETQFGPPDDHDERILTFGTLPSLAATIVPTALCRWREDNQSQRLKVVDKVQVELLLGLMRGNLDFVVAQTNCFDYVYGLKQRVLFRDRLYVIARAGHPAFRFNKLSWADLAQFPWVLPIGRQRTLLEHLIASERVALPTQLIECSSVDFIRTMVADTDHLGLLPAHAGGAELRGGSIRPLNVTQFQIKRDIAVIFRERNPLNDVSRSLVTHIQQVACSLASARIHAGCREGGSLRDELSMHRVGPPAFGPHLAA